MPEPTLRERANEKGLQHESAKKYRLSLDVNMYLHARNVDVDTFSEINIMKFNGGLMTDICIFCKSYFSLRKGTHLEFLIYAVVEEM